ncbi:helix-turn-helix domain-containing protein [Celerinatantimonas sp. YJH-8]|uniref:helix-turn-helix domain-containing protein n=1 Tax=Celerinatantimonas sp. YJH-8 TaxID=3228714 RepID=UPI0038BE99CC
MPLHYSNNLNNESDSKYIFENNKINDIGLDNTTIEINSTNSERENIYFQSSPDYDYKLVIVTQGRISVDINGSCISIDGNQMYIMTDDISKKVILNAFTNIIVINFCSRSLYSFFNEPLKLRKFSQEVVQEIVTMITGDRVDESKCYLLIELLLSEFHFRKKNVNYPILPRDRRLRKSLTENIQKNLEIPSLDSLVRVSGASQRTIYRCFVRDTGMSYQKWKQQFRFAKAVDLLKGDESVTDISLDLGFATPSSFICFFKERCKATPGSFRKLAHVE